MMDWTPPPPLACSLTPIHAPTPRQRDISIPGKGLGECGFPDVMRNGHLLYRPRSSNHWSAWGGAAPPSSAWLADGSLESCRRFGYGFALAGSLDLSGRTFCDRFAGLARETGYPFSPNLIVTLSSGILCPLFVPPTRENPTIMSALQGANNIYYVEHQDNSFQFLLTQLYTAYRSGRTVPTVAFDRYFARDGRLTLPGNGTLVEL